MKDFFDNQRILDIIWRRKIHLLVIGLLAIVLSVVFSGPFFITPKFKSTARIYPTNNIFTFSNESETEQMLEIVNSRDIKLKMFEAFRLDEVYKINREDLHYMTYMMDIYNSNISTSKTEFETVEIVVLDEDPNRAAQMCDSIIKFYNEKVGSMHSKKYFEVAEITGKYLENKRTELSKVSDELQELRNESQIINFETQVEEVTKGYMKALSNNTGRTQDAQKIKSQFETLNKRGIDAYQMENKFYSLTEIIDSLNVEKEIALLEAEKEITYAHIVEAPIAEDKKTYPVRWLIVVLSLISSFFAGLLLFLVLDYRKE